MADSSTTTALILNLIAGDCWAGRQLRNGIRYVPVTSKPMKSLSSVQGVSGIKLAIFYSMADYSTTAGRILLLFAGGCWTRRQLRGGIRYVSVASKPMNPPTLLKVVFLQVPELDGRFLNNHWADSGSDCGELLGSMPAT